MGPADQAARPYLIRTLGSDCRVGPIGGRVNGSSGHRGLSATQKWRDGGSPAKRQQSERTPTRNRLAFQVVLSVLLLYSNVSFSLHAAKIVC